MFRKIIGIFCILLSCNSFQVRYLNIYDRHLSCINDQDSKTKTGYRSLSRRQSKKRFKLGGLVEDHHIIPKQWRKHTIISDLGYNISANYNLIFLPTDLGKKRLYTSRLIHSGGHFPYNIYVKSRLDDIDNAVDLRNFVRSLKYSLRGKGEEIPWK